LEVSVIVPTRNERDNVGELVARLRQVLAGTVWEAIFVDDDSSDGTLAAVRALAADPRVRLIHRIGRRGLSTACIEGIQSSTAPYVAVIDADLQHDETLLPAMLHELESGSYDLVIGSRYVAGGGVDDWDRQRAKMSDFATRLGQLVLRTRIADPMSGFFMIRRDAFDRAVRNLSALGFKILIDLVASSPEPLRIKELPYHFRPRVAGESKLDSLVAWEYLVLLGDKLIGRYVPIRFVIFSVVGLVGLAGHLLVLGVVLRFAHTSFFWAQSAATFVAMIANFAGNNFITHSDRRLRGWALLRGLISFCLICAIGAVANLGISDYFVQTRGFSWWVGGIAGAAISAVWNYAVSSVITWKRH
jgi:dolichol-phosphate mannosyltransferase